MNRHYAISFNTCANLCFFTIGRCPKKAGQDLKKFNKESVPYIQVEELSGNDIVLLLDAREKEEFEVSHLEDALWVGHKTFEIDTLLKKVPKKNKQIVVYCSIGVRSENIGEKLQKAGYTNVKNLYGGIFEWKNRGYPVYNADGIETENVHAFSKHWGKLLTIGQKVYGPAEMVE
ncbi:rhodanese-like domain-containing protein [Maribacter halichondriae]|uniref:rhodanese-like domain-containing protein n=1 Tax=Maribacter halichondriae TaxID=2980554 RepID=UPI002358CDF3|nr:rhodanese-like domain-containing protein [Maribacter sp. Hal144]